MGVLPPAPFRYHQGMVHVFPGLWMTIALTLLSASLTLSSPVLLQDDPVLHMKSNQHQEPSVYRIPIQLADHPLLSTHMSLFRGNDYFPFSRLRRGGKCLFNSLAYNCDFKDAIGAVNEASYWGSSSPGR